MLHGTIMQITVLNGYANWLFAYLEFWCPKGDSSLTDDIAVVKFNDMDFII